jgi:aryl-alcohol dehydrogenase-like predicted oxidoreductase
MRYRPLAHHPMALSAVSLILNDGSRRGIGEWTDLIQAALDCGVNTFEVTGRDPAMLDGLGKALSVVERRLVFVAWRFGPRAMPPHLAAKAFSPIAMEGLTQAAIARTGLDYLDLVQLDDPGQHDLSPAGLQSLKQMRARGTIRMIGIAGESPEIDAYISTGAFETLSTPFNMLSGWRERNRIKAAGSRNMAVIGYDYYPEEMLTIAEAAKPKRGLLSWRRRDKGVAPQPYAFLHSNREWTAEEICLGYALTEPALVTMQIEPRDIEHIQTLAAVPERQLPSGLPAQIEMSRFANQGEEQRQA